MHRIAIAIRSARAAWLVIGLKLVLNQQLKDLIVRRLLPRVQTPGQYIGGELNAVVKDHRRSAASSAWRFPTPTPSA